MAFNKTLV